MSPDFAMVGLVALPLVAGVIAFIASGIAARLTFVVAAVQLGLATMVARSVSDGAMRYEIGGWGAPLGIDLYVDGLSALMLLMTAVLGLAVSLYAGSYFGQEPANDSDQYYWPLSLLLFAALNALFLSRDLFNLYVTLEMLMLASVALIGLAGTVEALAAAIRYLIVAGIASMLFLLGVALLYGNYGTVDLTSLATVVETDLPSRCGMILICVGLLLKTALFPLHFWLPDAHANAPAPASAMLSGLVLKSSFYVMLRLWFDVFPYTEMKSTGSLFGLLGAAAILWGSIQAIRQTHLKRLIAYSSVAQIGYLFLVFSLASETTTAWKAWSGVVYFALSHSLAKAAAFLAAGSLKQGCKSDKIEDLAGSVQQQPVTVFAFAIAGIGLMGLPPSGAFLSKWLLLQVAVSSANWGYAVVMLIGSVLAAVYVFRVIARTFSNQETMTRQPVSRWMQWMPLTLAVASLVLGVMALQPLGLLEIGAPFSPIPSGSAP